jgi:mRNA interferase RelE/StbE
MKMDLKNVIFSEKFQKNFRKLDAPTQIFIKKNLQEIFSGEKNPSIKKLKNYPIARYRLRIGNFRLLFNQLEGKIIFILIKHRKSLY